MEFEIRKARPEEMDDFRKVVKAALMMTAPDNLDPELTLCAFRDGKLVTSYAAWNMSLVLNGGIVPFAGVTDVGTHPVYRRHGFLRKVTSKHFENLHEEGKLPLSALYASRAAIYRRYGYSPVVTNCSYTVEPRFIQFIGGKEPVGTFREGSESDLKIFAQLYNRFIAKRTGYLQRSEENWKRKLNPPPNQPEHHLNFYVIYEEAGEPQGYMLYTAALILDGPNRWSQNIQISDIAWNSPSAFRAIWEYFSRMDVIIDVTCLHVPVDDPLPHLLLEPRKLNTTSRDGLLARIVDIPNALDKRGYNETGTLVFKVYDDFCPWNNGTWKLEASPDGSRVSSTSESPQLEMPLSTLTLLFFGQISATEAWQMGRLDVIDPNCLPLWDKVLRTAFKPACADSF